MAGKYNNIMITFDERGKGPNATYAISNSTYVNFRNYVLMYGTGKYLKEVAPTSSYANKILVANISSYNQTPNSSTRYKFISGTNAFIHYYNYNQSPQNTKAEHMSKAMSTNAHGFQPEILTGGWGIPYGRVYGYDYVWSDAYVQHVTFSIAVSDYAITGISDGSEFLYTDLTDAVLTSPYISTILKNITWFRPYINDRSKLHDDIFVMGIVMGQSYTPLSVPDVNSTTKSSAQSTYDRAQSYYDAATRIGINLPNYSSIISNYNSIKSAYDSIVARDARLTKKADKTELNTANNKARVEYTTPYTQGTDDYTSIKSALTALSKKLNS